MTFNYTAHRKLWHWLSKFPNKQKHEWPGWAKYGDVPGGITNDCFCCEAAGYYNFFDCEHIYQNCVKHCPLFTKPCFDREIYSEWQDPDINDDRRSELACMIRDLPIREDWHGKVI